MREAYTNALEGIIERKMVIDAFAKEGGQIPEWALDKRVNEVRRESFKNDEQQLRAALAEDGITEEEWRDQIREQIIFSSMRSAKVTANINICEQDIRTEYETHIKDRYTTPMQAHIRMIVLEKWLSNLSSLKV